jgi:HAD superfamily hydrolase (TIGR01484 family)
VGDVTIAALERARASGRRLILVTGRELDELLGVFPRLELFDRVVAENGALLYRPASREITLLAEPPTEEFVQALVERGVQPLSVGRVIVATWTPHETAVLDVIRDQGLEHQIIFNKGAVMVLPSGVNKATGLKAALSELGLSVHNAVGVGDAENDHAFLSLCECAVAVANALPALKDHADLVTSQERGAGVVELIDALVASDLREVAPRLARHDIPLGTRDDGTELRVSPYGESVLLAGASGSGKSTWATGFLERTAARGYQFCIVDPEGDYEGFEGATVLGDGQRPPGVAEILELLEQPDQYAVANLLGVKLEDRPGFFEALLSRLQELRRRTGRPHWIVVDEAHHMLPPLWGPAALALPPEPTGLLLITVHPDQVAPAALAAVDTVIAVGEAAGDIIRGFSRALGRPAPSLPRVRVNPGQALAWSRRADGPVVRLSVILGHAERRRHVHKYAEGDLGPHSFCFRGPDGRLNLRAQNLMLFVQVADGVDDATWLHHLSRGDYSRWFREAIKDDDLASEAACVERRTDLSPCESRALIKAAIEDRYTSPTQAS